jgi:hypothetical protein
MTDACGPAARQATGSNTRQESIGSRCQRSGAWVIGRLVVGQWLSGG